MADIPNLKWYDEGTVAITKGTTTVKGTNTFWVSAGVKAGDIFVDADKKIYEITAVDDSTSLTLGSSYAGETGSGKSYSIIRTFNATMTASLASQIATLLSEFEKRYDLDMQTIMGKSAYDIAKEEGFTGTKSEWLTSISAYGVAVSQGYQGTQAEWLESLKAAGEWASVSGTFSAHASDISALQTLTASQGTSISTLQTDTDPMRYHTASTHNMIYRGKNLGTVITDEQLANIRNGTYKDIYPGDVWILNGKEYRVMHLGLAHMYNSGTRPPNNVILFASTPGNGYYGSFGESTDEGFVGSNIYKGTGWETVCENVINAIGEEHIQTSSQQAIFTRSTAVDENGVITGLVGVSGLQIALPTAYNVWGNLYPLDKGLSGELGNGATAIHRYTHFAAWKAMGVKQIHWRPWENAWTDSFAARNRVLTIHGTPGITGCTDYREVKPIIAITGETS